MPTGHENFRRRVAQLRDSWEERRALKGFAGASDFNSQYTLLTTIYRWVEEAVADIRDVYGDTLAVNLGPEPNPGGPPPAFALTLGDATTLTFAMVERTRSDSPRWAIAVTIGTGGPAGAVVAAGPERRSAQWTRARVEDILLSVLGAHERAASEGGGGWPPASPRLRRG